MSPRIIRRLHGREQSTSFSAGATHTLKIGWKGKSKGGKEIPTRLRGFVVCRNSVGPDGSPIIDFDVMGRLGFKKPEIEQGIARNYNAEDGLLPSSVPVMLLYDAKQSDRGGWEFPGTFAEEFACYNKEGLFCRGNGVTASRKRKDGTREVLECVPKGAADMEAKSFCEYSVNKQCKPHGRLIVMLANVAPGDGPEWARMDPIGSTFRATYRVDTCSDYSLMQIATELERVAELLGGWICGLCGSLSVQYEQKRRPDGGATIVPQLRLVFDEGQVSWRQAKVREEQRQMLVEGKPLQPIALPAPAVEAAVADSSDAEPETFDEPFEEPAEPEPPADGAEDAQFDDGPSDDFSGFGGDSEPPGIDPKDEEDLDFLREKLADIAEQAKCKPDDVLAWHVTEMKGAGPRTVGGLDDCLRGDNAAYKRAAQKRIFVVLRRHREGDVPSAADIRRMQEVAT